jgi:hypothetical protein
MTDSGIGEKEQIQILLAEYSSLRSEINSRITSVYQVAAIAAVAAAWLLQQTLGARFFIGVALTIIGLSLCAWVLIRDCIRASIRVQELEKEINRRAGDRLLVWETEWGGNKASPLWRNNIIHILLRLTRPPYSK